VLSSSLTFLVHAKKGLTFAENTTMITLAHLQPEQGTCFYPWISDPEVIHYSLSVFQALKTPAQIDDWFAATLREQNSVNLGIYLQETNSLIGYAGLTNLSATNRSGEYFILIGEKAYWGIGVGTAVTKQVLTLGFTELQLNRIMLTVSEANLGGIKAYTNAGFVIEGRLRAASCRNGLFHDKIVMSILQAEWQQ
jgi:RimJ/RimL family protein N-acetyltransferase